MLAHMLRKEANIRFIQAMLGQESLSTAKAAQPTSLAR
jgi:site-specific recombinase XerD